MLSVPFGLLPTKTRLASSYHIIKDVGNSEKPPCRRVFVYL